MATAKTKTKKPTDDQILSAMKVLEDLGDRDSYSYEKLVAQLPRGKRPPAQSFANASALIIGVDDLYSMPDATFNKIEEAVRKAWTPVNVKIGARTYIVEFRKLEG